MGFLRSYANWCGCRIRYILVCVGSRGRGAFFPEGYDRYSAGRDGKASATFIVLFLRKEAAVSFLEETHGSLSGPLGVSGFLRAS